QDRQQVLVVLAHDLEQEVVRAGDEHDVVDFRDRRERVGDRADVTLGLDADHGLAPEPESQRVGDADDLYDVAFDQAVDALAYRGLGETDGAGDTRVRHAAVFLQQFDDRLVGVVERARGPALHYDASSRHRSVKFSTYRSTSASVCCTDNVHCSSSPGVMK